MALSFKFSDLQVEIASKAQMRSKPDPSTLSFGEYYSDHMFEVEWRKDSGWGVPKIVPLHPLQYHPGCQIFHCAQAVFEGTKAFRSSDGSVALFRPDLNVKRLLASAERAALPLFDGDEFLKCLKKLISIDKDWIPNTPTGSLYIRPTFIGTHNAIGINLRKALLYIITLPTVSKFRDGVMIPISLFANPDFVRAWPGGVGDKKMACNYASSIYVIKLAQEQGFQQILCLMGDDHRVTEAGIMNIFFLFQKGPNQYELATPALDGTILPGVTRRSLLELAKQFNEFDVNERSITMSEVVAATEKKSLVEVFVCGTAYSVTPVNVIRYLQTDIRVPTMERENPLYKRLYKALTDIQYGKVYSEWSVKVD